MCRSQHAALTMYPLLRLYLRQYPSTCTLLQHKHNWQPPTPFPCTVLSPAHDPLQNSWRGVGEHDHLFRLAALPWVFSKSPFCCVSCADHCSGKWGHPCCGHTWESWVACRHGDRPMGAHIPLGITPSVTTPRPSWAQHSMAGSVDWLHNSALSAQLRLLPLRRTSGGASCRRGA